MGRGSVRRSEMKAATSTMLGPGLLCALSLLALLALLGASVSSCSATDTKPRSQGGSPSTEAQKRTESQDSAASNSDSQPERSTVVPVSVFPPTQNRWSYLPEPVTAQIPIPDTGAELLELAELRSTASAPRPPGSDDRFTRVAEGTPTRFLDLAVDVGRRRSLNPLRMARNSALIAVAAHEAAVTAARTPLPDGQSPAQVDPEFAEPIPGIDSVGIELPSRQLPPELVASSAQRSVACALYVVECLRFDRLQQIAKQRVVASGALWPSTITAAQQLGNSVGLAVLAFAATDGAAPWVASSADPWPGGDWVPTPGMFAPAMEPFAGTWRPWNLDSGSQFRPSAPPAPGSAEHAAAIEQVLAEATNLSDRELRVAAFWDQSPGTSTPPGYWISDIAADSLRQAPVADQASGLALVSTAALDAGIAAWDSKFAYWTVRPVTVIRDSTSPHWLPSLQTPPFPAYVSGHAAFSTAAAQIMSVLRPERTDELLNAAAEATDSRLTGGLHYWFDLVQGAALGQKVGDAALRKAGLPSVPSGVVPVAERLRYKSADVRTRPAK